MDYNFLKTKKADSVPEGLQEKYTFLPTFMPTMRRTSSRDDILKFYRYFDLVENNSGYLFTWKHYLNILKEQLREFEMIVYKSKTIICSMSSTASSETSVYTPNLEGNKNLIDESCTRRGVKTDINLKSEVSKEFVFSPDICKVKQLPSLEENAKHTFELPLGNESKSCPSASEIFLDEGFVFEETSEYSNSEENKINPYDLPSKMNTNTELETACIIEMVPSSSTSYNDVFEKSHFEEKSANAHESLIGYSEKDLEITSAVENNLTQDVSDDTVLDCAPSKIQAYGFPVEYNFGTDHTPVAGFGRSAHFFSDVDLDMETTAELITKSKTEIVTSSNARYNDVIAKSHLEEKPPNGDDYRINNSVDDLEIASVAEKDLHQDVRYDAVSENILPETHADGSGEGFHISTEPTPESDFKGSNLLFSGVNLNMNTITELFTKSTTEMVISPDDSYNDANAKSHIEGRPSKVDTDNSVNVLQITSVVENDSSHVFCYDAVLENVSPETPTEHPFSTEPISDAKFTRPTHSFPDDSLNMNITSEMVFSPGVSYKDTVRKSPLDGKGSKADSCLADNSVNYLKSLSSKGEDLSQNVSCSKISPSKTNAYELSMEYHFINACASEVEYTIATISHSDGNFNRCTTSELNPESEKRISSLGSSYNDAFEKSSLDGQRMNVDPGSLDNSANDFEIEYAIDRYLSLDSSYDQVSEKISSKRDANALPVQYDSSIKPESDTEVTTKATNFVPEIKHDEVAVKSSPKGKGTYSDETSLKSDTIIATASSVTLGKGLDFSPDISMKEISKRSSVSRISKAKVLKNVILDLKNVSKQIHKTIEKISSLSTCAKCGAPLQRICKSKPCLEPTENAGDMAIQLQTVSKINKEMGSFQNNILLGDARKSPMEENVCSTLNTERGDENPLKTLI